MGIFKKKKKHINVAFIANSMGLLLYTLYYIYLCKKIFVTKALYISVPILNSKQSFYIKLGILL